MLETQGTVLDAKRMVFAWAWFDSLVDSDVGEGIFYKKTTTFCCSMW
jgi:hypothetical protein